MIQDPLGRAEAAIRKVAEQNVKLAETMQALAESQERSHLKTQALAGSQKHTNSKVDALTNIVGQWMERNGSGGAGH